MCGQGSQLQPWEPVWSVTKAEEGRIVLSIYIAGCPEIQEAWSPGPHLNLEGSCWIEPLHMETWQAVSDMNYTVGTHWYGKNLPMRC